MRPVDSVIDRLDARPTGADRWRAACPVCGERNKSTLSIGVGDNGAVLLKCFKSECSPDQIVSALGLELSDLFPPKDSRAGPLKRRSMLSAKQALDLLMRESLVVFVVASDVHRERQISETDWCRLRDAAAAIQKLGQETYE